MKLLDLDLDVYQGPFDLLFTLILKEEVDICEVRLAEIILAYLEALVAEEATDWEGLSEFLVLISALLELKSRLLLPGEAPAEEELDSAQARDLLLQRLLGYRKFKGAALSLQERLEENRGRWLRPPTRPSQRPLAASEDIAGAQKPDRLKDALRRVLEARRGPDTSHISPARVDLRRQILAVRNLLAEKGRISFDEAFGEEEPMTQAVTIFALLELLSQGTIRVSQRAAFADITILARDERRKAAPGLQPEVESVA